MAVNVRKSTEESGVKMKYTGLANMSVVAVSPTKAVLETFGFTPEKDPAYVTEETIEKNGKNVVIKTARFNFILRLDIDGVDDGVIIQHSIFLKGVIRKSKDEKKIEIIDKFGKSAYVTPEEFKSRNIPFEWIDANSISPALEGQVELITFMRTLAGYLKEDTMVLNDLSPGGDFKNLFKPDDSGFKEIKSDVKECADNKVKFLLGVRTTDDGKVYQDVFPYAIGRPFAKTEYFHRELTKIAYSGSKFMDTRFFGKIDFTKDKPNDDDYRLKEYVDGSSYSNARSDSMPNGYPDSWDVHLEESETVDALDDPFAV